MSDESVESDSGFDRLASSYRQFHGYFSVIWCSLAIVFNVLTVVLLQHRTMKSTTNFLLCCTSLQQLVLCTLYLLFASLFYLSALSANPDGLPHQAAVVLYIYVILSTLANTILMWCTVTVACFRLICIVFPHRPELCSMLRARIAVTMIVLFAAVCTIPAVLAHEVRVSSVSIDNQSNLSTVRYTVEISNSLYGDLAFWISAVLCKLVPSVLLAVLSFLLVRRMRSADRRRQTLMKGHGHTPAPSDQQCERNRRTQRTTSLLATIAVLFAVVYFPQSALEILGAFSNQVKLFYQRIGDVLDELSLINNGVTFILHCVMSQQFRTTLMIVLMAPLARTTGNSHNATSTALLRSKTVETHTSSVTTNCKVATTPD